MPFCRALKRISARNSAFGPIQRSRSACSKARLRSGLGDGVPVGQHEVEPPADQLLIAQRTRIHRLGQRIERGLINLAAGLLRFEIGEASPRQRRARGSSCDGLAGRGIGRGAIGHGLDEAEFGERFEIVGSSMAGPVGREDVDRFGVAWRRAAASRGLPRLSRLIIGTMAAAASRQSENHAATLPAPRPCEGPLPARGAALPACSTRD